MSDDVLRDSLRQWVVATVARTIAPGPVALLDFPTYANPGDSAIWLGAHACLSASGYGRLAYTSDQHTFDERMLRRSMPSGTILLAGGGNFGDLWPAHQAFRERVVREFPDHAIVQLPQTIHFDHPSSIKAARATFARHRNFTVLVRDAPSLELARSSLGCRAALCPDLALSLSAEVERCLRRERASARAEGTIRLQRTDHESDDPQRGSAAHAVDWVHEVETPLMRYTRSVANRLARRISATRAPSVGDRASRAFLSACEPYVARQRMRRGCRLLRSARVVVTDRLHGHILALLLGVPHVVLGDRNGKLRGFVDTWTSTATLMRWADGPGDVERHVEELSSCC